jgi:hypothetical protein
MLNRNFSREFFDFFLQEAAIVQGMTVRTKKYLGEM